MEVCKRQHRAFLMTMISYVEKSESSAGTGVSYEDCSHSNETYDFISEC